MTATCDLSASVSAERSDLTFGLILVLDEVHLCTFGHLLVSAVLRHNLKITFGRSLKYTQLQLPPESYILHFDHDVFVINFTVLI